jgi:tetratricopeptide (TPR) repeat protein
MGKVNKHLCPCGSGKRARLCCREAPGNQTLSLTRTAKLEMRKTVESLAHQGKHLEACEILEKLAAQSPHNPLIWNDLGVQYEAAGQIEKAFAALKCGHQADPTYPPALYNLGKFTLDRCTSLREAGVLSDAELHAMLSQSIGLLNANLDRDPDNADAHYHIALAYALNHDEPMALAHMTVALRLKEALEAPPGWRIK